MFISKIIQTRANVSSANKQLKHVTRNLFRNEEDVFLHSHEGDLVKTKITKPTKNDWYIVKDKILLGELHFITCSSEIMGDNLPAYYKKQKYLFIKSPLNSTRKYKGIGSELIKAAVRESQRQGLDGRICLTASTINPELGSPVPFYYKMGFKSVNREIQEIIEDCMRNNKPLPEKCLSTTMYLPKEAIQKLLAA